MTRKFLYLNGIAIICVVLFHTAGMGFVAMFNWGHRYLPSNISVFEQIGSISYYFLRFIEQIVPFCIPAFFIVSGFFVYAVTDHSRRTISWDIVFARVRTLLIPYLIWSAIALTLKALQGDIFSPLEYIRFILIGSTNEVYYFIPLLIQMYLLSPILILASRKNWKLFLSVVGIFQLLQLLSFYPEFFGSQNAILSTLPMYIPKWLFLSRIFWFSCGIVIGMHPNEFIELLHKYYKVLIFLAVLLIPLGMIEWEIYYRASGQEWLSSRETLVDTIYSVAVIGVILGYPGKSLPKNKPISNIGSKSYGIYLIHVLIIEYTARVIYHLLPSLLGVQWILQPVLFILGLGIPLILMWVVRKLNPGRFYSYLFG